MLDRRPSAVSGAFYPDDPDELARAVDDFLARVTVEPGERVPKALVVPHAGYIYSGPIAASAFARLRPAKSRIERVVLIGPAHRAPVNGLVSPGARALETPLGDIDVDLSALARVPEVGVSVFAHSMEHSLEVEFPFLQRVLPRARLVPLAAGHADAESVGRTIEALWGGPETAIVISSDFSHYLPYAQAQATDRETIARILALDIDGLASERACGATGLRGLLWVAQRKRLSARAFDVRNSGDTAGDRKRVVGYAAIGFYETE